MGVMRKDKVFSVSMTTEEVDKVEGFLERCQESTGMELSRNQLIRKVLIAFVNVKQSNKNPTWEQFEKEFKNVGCKTKTKD